MVFYLLLARLQAEHERLCQKNVSRTTRNNLWNLYSTNHSPANFHNSALTPTVVLRQVSKRLLSVKNGTNGEREMAYMLYLAGFDVKDVTMTDLVSGRETLEDINFIVFCGGFSNSDVLGSAKGWARSFLVQSQSQSCIG